MNLASRLVVLVSALSFFAFARGAPAVEEAGPTVSSLRAMRGALRTLNVTPRDLTDQETMEFRALIAQSRTHLGALIATYALKEMDDAQLGGLARLGLRLSQLAAKSKIVSSDCGTLREIEQHLRAAREESGRKRM